jgi:hypothetical protein
MSEKITCSDCGREVGPLEVFPKRRCLDCHAIAPETIRETETMTAERLAAMWGAAPADRSNDGEEE